MQSPILLSLPLAFILYSLALSLSQFEKQRRNVGSQLEWQCMEQISWWEMKEESQVHTQQHNASNMIILSLSTQNKLPSFFFKKYIFYLVQTCFHFALKIMRRLFMGPFQLGDPSIMACWRELKDARCSWSLCRFLLKRLKILKKEGNNGYYACIIVLKTKFKLATRDEMMAENENAFFLNSQATCFFFEKNKKCFWLR